MGVEDQTIPKIKAADDCFLSFCQRDYPEDFIFLSLWIIRKIKQRPDVTDKGLSAACG
jgi:hypothetical protein